MSLLTMFGVFPVILLAGLTTYALLKKQEAERRLSSIKAEAEAIRKQAAKLEKYRHIPDVLEKAKRTEEQIQARLDQAKKKAAEIAAEAEEHVRAAQAEASKVIAAAKAEAKSNRQAAEQALDDATVYASEIVKAAEKKASEIGGKAYEAMKKSDHFTKVAAAMRNAVEGYGDRYMKPGETILDELAAEYGFHKAGERLRVARERVRIIQKNHTAATCEYAEANRRQLAIRFVLDAFNGKVESILAKLKPNNAGRLRQEIKDAFALVNFNGSAFRDASITEQYLDARLDELTAAQAVQALKIREREEQQAIKERIRDEEKAKREIERALKQAQRDERLIKEAMEKVRSQYEAAGLADRAGYESKLSCPFGRREKPVRPMPGWPGSHPAFTGITILPWVDAARWRRCGARWPCPSDYAA
jgi:hypothetical protein